MESGGVGILNSIYIAGLIFKSISACCMLNTAGKGGSLATDGLFAEHSLEFRSQSKRAFRPASIGTSYPPVIESHRGQFSAGCIMNIAWERRQLSGRRTFCGAQHSPSLRFPEPEPERSIRSADVLFIPPHAGISATRGNCVQN